MNELIVEFSRIFEQEGWFAPKSVDFRHLRGTNCFCSHEAFEEISSSLAPFGAGGLAWIDTGDYHYVSAVRMKFIKQPFSMLLLDNHPDDQASELECGIMSCGSWMKWSKENLKNLNYPPVPGLPLFISIDTDILSPEYAVTDWNQGDWDVDKLFGAVEEAVSVSGGLIGVDVCGGLTVEKGASDRDLEKNRFLRTKIRSFFERKSFFV